MRIVPRTAEASPFWLGSDAPNEAYVSAGRHGTQFEIWHAGDPAAFERAVCRLLRAVVDGGYEEWVRTRGERVQSKGVFHAADKPVTVHYNLLLGVMLERRGFRHVRYAPYA